MPSNNGPTKVFSVRPVEAAIWPREPNGRPGAQAFEVRISRNYRDAQDWHQTNRFSVEDLPKVIAVAQEAYRYLALREFTPRAGTQTQEAKRTEEP